jgi:hypothetical protein
MAYGTADVQDYQEKRKTPSTGVLGSPPRRERLHAGLMLLGLFALAAAFWAGVIYLLSMT